MPAPSRRSRRGYARRTEEHRRVERIELRIPRMQHPRIIPARPCGAWALSPQSRGGPHKYGDRSDSIRPVQFRAKMAAPRSGGFWRRPKTLECRGRGRRGAHRFDASASLSKTRGLEWTRRPFARYAAKPVRVLKRTRRALLAGNETARPEMCRNISRACPGFGDGAKAA